MVKFHQNCIKKMTSVEFFEYEIYRDNLKGKKRKRNE